MKEQSSLQLPNVCVGTKSAKDPNIPSRLFRRDDGKDREKRDRTDTGGGGWGCAGAEDTAVV